MADSQRKTANLFDGTLDAGYYSNTDFDLEGPVGIFRSFKIYLVAGTYSIKWSIPVRAVREIKNGVMTLNPFENRDTWTLQVNTDGYYGISFRNLTSTQWDNSVTIMLNEGQTALPYEPYGWLHSLRKLTTATEAIENPLYSDGTAITSYTIKGNTVQDGTPTPSNPVDVNGVGKKTVNLFNATVESGAISSSAGTDLDNNERLRSSYVDLAAGTYTLGASGSAVNVFLYLYNTDGSYVGTYTSSWSTYPFTFTLNTAMKCRFVWKKSAGGVISVSDIYQIMLNTGSTLLPYEPYGYKIPISSPVVTTNIDLGSTQGYRVITKYICTGQEQWGYDATFTRFFRTFTDLMGFGLRLTPMYCTHYECVSDGRSMANVPNHAIYTGSGTDAQKIYFKEEDITSEEAWKTWLQQQYNNGTPVTLWYILETATTGIVNEPLMKIGDYADTLSNATAIPTTEGANSITVDTTVQPSEFTATWTGWHNTYVKEKSENLFDISTAMQGKQYDENGVLVDAESNWYATDYIPVTGGETYIRSVGSVGIGSVYNEYNNQKQFIGRYTPTYGTPFTVGQNTTYITFSINTATTAIDNYMLNSGQTALPYEPYWK